jgi:hypothetical protein
MLYMVIERFKNNNAEPVYRRFGEKGRMLPEGLRYLQSWVDLERSRCFQLMESEDPALLTRWTRRWEDLVDFEIIPVRTSADTVARASEEPRPF